MQGVKCQLRLFITLRITLLCAVAFHSTNSLSANTASVAAREVLQPALTFLLPTLFSVGWSGKQWKGTEVSQLGTTA